MAANGVPQVKQSGSGVVEVECDSTTSTNAQTDTPTTDTQTAPPTLVQIAAPTVQSSPAPAVVQGGSPRGRSQSRSPEQNPAQVRFTHVWGGECNSILWSSFICQVNLTMCLLPARKKIPTFPVVPCVVLYFLSVTNNSWFLVVL